MKVWIAVDAQGYCFVEMHFYEKPERQGNHYYSRVDGGES